MSTHFLIAGLGCFRHLLTNRAASQGAVSVFCYGFSSDSGTCEVTAGIDNRSRINIEVAAVLNPASAFGERLTTLAEGRCRKRWDAETYPATGSKTDPQHLCSKPASSFNTDIRVFENNAVFGRHPEQPSGDQITLGIGLMPADVVTGNDHIK
jgi:hypothetical protein